MTKTAYSPTKVKKLKALHDHIIVTDMSFDERISQGGIVLLSDNGQSTGIRPRWGQVYAVGSEQHDVKIGQWVCVAHGRWTRGLEIEDANGIKTIRRVDPSDILLVSDDMPNDSTMSDAIDGRTLKTSQSDFI